MIFERDNKKEAEDGKTSKVTYDWISTNLFAIDPTLRELSNLGNFHEYAFRTPSLDFFRPLLQFIYYLITILLSEDPASTFDGIYQFSWNIIRGRPPVFPCTSFLRESFGVCHYHEVACILPYFKGKALGITCFIANITYSIELQRDTNSIYYQICYNECNFFLEFVFCMSIKTLGGGW